MKKIVLLLISMTLLVYCVGCGVENPNDSDNKTNNINSPLVETPTQEYIIDCLLKTPNILEVVPVTEENDPNGDLGGEGGYYSSVYFSVDLIDQNQVSGDDLIAKGTDAGGCIEAYKTLEDANNRNTYLSKYDNSWLFNSGYHSVVGTLVVRISKELSADEQSKLESNIIDVLLGKEIVESISKQTSDNDVDSDLSNTPSKIKMPQNASDYIGLEWNVETITEHFKSLGFTNIYVESRTSHDYEFDTNILELNIKDGWFSTRTWKAGEEFESNARITIIYYESPYLTINNCPDLQMILSTKSMNYISFCTAYDGRLVEFDAYVIGHSVYDGGTSHIIDVAGGDPDEKSEINVYDESTYKGLAIRIGDRTFNNKINENVEVGDLVKVKGKINLSWAKFYKCVYVETIELDIR